MLKAVARGEISLSDNPQKYFDFWTNDTQDPRSHITLQHLMSLSSGYSDRDLGRFSYPCVNQANITTVECVKQIYEAAKLIGEPGNVILLFFYTYWCNTSIVAFICVCSYLHINEKGIGTSLI